MTVQLNLSQSPEIDALALNQQLKFQEVTLLDVRESGEYATEHIAGSVCMPLSAFDPDRVTQISDKPLVVCCQSGMRSNQAFQKLVDSGFTNVTQLKGGLIGWKASGLKTQGYQNAPISLFRQVQIVAGSLVAIGTGLGVFVSPWFLLLSGFVGCGLIFAGITDTCAMGILLAKLPYNQRN